jgi:hypothetical protein
MGGWLRDLRISSKDRFHNWLMSEVGYENYLKYQLWDDNALMYYITTIACDNLHLRFLEHETKVQTVNFRETKSNE